MNSQVRDKYIPNIGLLCAMPEEIGTALEHLNNLTNIKFGDLKIISGIFDSKSKDYPLINLKIAWSGWGKVSSARATARMIGLFERFNLKPDFLVFTGVAGGIKKDLNQWDVIVPNKLMQHDIDARPIYEKYVIPQLDQIFLSPPKKLTDWAFKSINKSINYKEINFSKNVHRGLVASGDQFVSESKKIKELLQNIPNLSAVEMEGASFAQVASQEKIPWLILRVISDNADESAAKEFNEFLKEYNKNSWFLIETLLNKLDFLDIRGL